MKVVTKSANGALTINLSLSVWAALLNATHTFEGNKIQPWKGTFEPFALTPEQLTLITNRIQQIAGFIPTLQDLANNGGATLVLTQ